MNENNKQKSRKRVQRLDEPAETVRDIYDDVCEREIGDIEDMSDFKSVYAQIDSSHKPLFRQ